MTYSRAPVIHNTGGRRGVYVQGSFRGIPEDDQIIFKDMVKGFSDIVLQGAKLTGAQWLGLIGKSVGEVGLQKHAVKQCMGVVRSVMMVDKYSDDFILFDPKKQPRYRGKKGACVDAQYGLADLEVDDLSGWKLSSIDQIQVRQMDEVRLLMAKNHAEQNAIGTVSHGARAQNKTEVAFDLHFYDVDAGYKLYVPVSSLNNPEAPIGIRALKMMQKDVMFSPSNGAGDAQAALFLLHHLCNNFGYTSLAVRNRDFYDHHYFVTGDQTDIADTEEMAKHLKEFIRHVSNKELLSTSPVLLCRPGPLINLPGACEAFESPVGNEHIGYSIPTGFWREFLKNA